MSEEKTVREFWIRTKVFSNDGYAFGNPEAAKHEINVPIIHVIEHSAYLAVKQELDAARVELWQAKGALGYPVPGHIPCGDFVCGLCDAKSKQLAEKDAEIVNSNKFAQDQEDRLADAKAQIADYEAALESCELYPNGMTNIKVKETLNKWRAK